MIVKRPLIVDVSHWEQNADYPADPPLLLITKLTQGDWMVDAFAGYHLDAASAAGSFTGVYHFLEQDDIASQIDHFLETCELAGVTKFGIWQLTVPPILDVEVTATVPPQEFAAQVKAWLDGVESRTGLRPWIYTSQNYWGYTGSPTWVGQYKLWLAWYPFDPDDLEAPPAQYIPKGWASAYLWQYTDEGHVACFPTEAVDLNKASETLLADLGQPKPPTGATMYAYKIEPAGDYVNIRPDHSTTSGFIRQLKKGEIAEGNVIYEAGTGETLERWLNIQTPVVGWVAEYYKGVMYGILTPQGTTPPPSGGIAVSVSVDGANVFSASYPAGSQIAISVS